MFRRFLLLLCLCCLVACSGIPLRSLPRLVKLQSELLEANPAEFMVAIQADARMAPPPDASPILQIAIRPAEAGAFEAIDRKLPMRFAVSSATTLGLAAPPSNRRWLIYSLTPESQAELTRIQDFFKRRQSDPSHKKGGTLSLGIAQDGVASKDTALANTRWESWLQVSRQEGFFDLWSGSVAELLKQAQAGK